MNTLVLVLLMAAANPLFETRTLDGKTLTGGLVGLDAQRLRIESPQGETSLEVEKLVAISNKQPSVGAAKSNSVSVELQDGSVVVCQQYTSAAGRAKLALFDGPVLEIPVRDVVSVRLQRESEALAAEWTRLLRMKREADLLVVRKDDVLDYHQGVLHDVTDDMVRFDVDGDVLPVKRIKVYGMAYRHRVEGELPQPVCRVGDATGSLWSAKAIAISDKVELTTVTGTKVSLPIEKLVQIDFSGGKIAYLSDMEPKSVHWTPFFGGGKSEPAVEQFFAPRQNVGFDKNPLQLGGTQYAKGLAFHSRTEAVYQLPDGFSRFHATAGIEDAVRPSGKVRLVIRGDDKVLLETVAAGVDPPLPIDLDVTGIRRLTILVDFADAVNVGDHLLLCDARVTK
jgi:hypothetical protein